MKAFRLNKYEIAVNLFLTIKYTRNRVLELHVNNSLEFKFLSMNLK